MMKMMMMMIMMKGKECSSIQGVAQQRLKLNLEPSKEEQAVAVVAENC